MNIKKLFATLAGVSMFVSTVVPNAAVFGATYSEELQGAYDWAYENGITTMSSIDNANMYGAITRAEMAKMLANYAKNLMGKEADTSAACSFTDTASVQGDLATAIVEACQLGIMGQGISAFRPYDTISRAEFGTALSRLLWGTTYEGGTPYYAKHLDALKAAGIMTQIANAESTKEVRGYVMLMLQRASGLEGETEECDAMAKLICNADPENSLCPAACRPSEEDNNEDEEVVVKAGDLAVTAEAAAGKKILMNIPSDLDTLTFRTSENVEITKVILERYGYSRNDDVANIRLEDENGNMLTEKKQLDSKGLAKLSIKKNYRDVDGILNATIVVEATGTGGNTMGFKVVDVESSAENLNVDNYKPYTYEMVDYNGSEVALSARGTTKDYNYEAGESYEIGKFKVKAPADSAILVKGFTLTNAASSKVDMKEYLENLTLKAAGEDVKVSYSFDKDNEDKITVSFDDVKVAAKETVEFVLNAEFADDFDNYGDSIKFNLVETSDFSAIDSKTESRVRPTGTPLSLPTYNFLGGKVKLSNTKLGNVDAAQNSTDVVVAEGSITLPEAIKGAIWVPVTTGIDAIDAMRVTIAGEEYDGHAVKSATFTGYVFSGVEIEKSGKVQFKIDTVDTGAYNGSQVKFGSFNESAWRELKYVEAKDATVQFNGSISFSTVTIQAAKASLDNKATKEVEFLASETSNKKVIFDGTYTAKKGTVNLTDFVISGAANTHNITFYVTIGDEEAEATIKSGSTGAADSLNVTIEAGKSASVKVEAEVEASANTGSLGKYTLKVRGEDENGNLAGEASRNTVSLKVVTKGTASVESTAGDKTLRRATSNAKVAEFIVRPAKGSSEFELEDISFDLSGVSPDEVTVTIDDRIEDSVDNSAFLYERVQTVDSNGITVTVELNDEQYGEIALTNLKVNGKEFSDKEFKVRYEEAIVRVDSSRKLTNGMTEFTLDVDADSDLTIKNLYFTFDTGTAEQIIPGSFSDGKTVSIKGVKDDSRELVAISYDVYGSSRGVNDQGAVAAADAECTLSETIATWTAETCGTANVFDEVAGTCALTGNAAAWTSQEACGTVNTFTPAVEEKEADHYTVSVVKKGSTGFEDFFKLSDKTDVVVFQSNN